jgi:uncharacterized protein YdaU (DUF1376 family)
MPKEDKRPPAFLLYPNDFCSDGVVEAMTTEEVGAYFLLLCKAWMEDPAGTVPDDDRVLARWARLTQARWAKCKSSILAAFRLQDGRWHQGRMKREYAAWQDSKQEKSERAKRAADARWNHADAMQTHGPSMPQAMLKNAISVASSVALSPATTATASAQCMDRGVWGERWFQPPSDYEPPAAMLRSMDTILSIIHVSDPDQLGFLSQLAHADAAGLDLGKSLFDYLGRAKSKGNPAGYILESVRRELGPERWQEFMRRTPSAGYCQAIIAKEGM